MKDRGFLAVIVLVAAGCATANVPPPKPLAEGDLKRLAWRWTGIWESQRRAPARLHHPGGRDIRRERRHYAVRGLAPDSGWRLLFTGSET